MKKTYYKATITNTISGAIILYKVFLNKAELDAWLNKISTVPLRPYQLLNIYQQTLEQKDLRSI